MWPDLTALGTWPWPWLNSVLLRTWEHSAPALTWLPREMKAVSFDLISCPEYASESIHSVLKIHIPFSTGQKARERFLLERTSGHFSLWVFFCKAHFWHLFYRKLDRGWRPQAMLTSRFSKYKKQWLIHQKTPRLQNLSWPPVTKFMPHLSFSGSSFAFYPKSFAFIKVRNAIT